MAKSLFCKPLAILIIEEILFTGIFHTLYARISLMYETMLLLLKIFSE